MSVPPLFGQLSLPEQQTLLHIGRRKSYRHRAVLCFEGDPSSEVFVLLSGWVKAWASTESGKLLLLRVHQRGDLLGAEPVLADRPRPETLKAEGEIEVLTIPAERFTTFLALHPWVARTVNAMFVLRLTDAYRQRAHEVANDSPHRRLAEVLIDLRGQLGRRCQGDDSFVELRVPLSQEELGSLAGLSRTSVTRVLNDWRECGLVTTGYRSLRISIFLTRLGLCLSRAPQRTTTTPDQSVW